MHMPHIDASQNLNNFVLLASHLPSRRVWPDIICAIRGDNPADLTARTGAGAVPASGLVNIGGGPGSSA